MQYEDIVYKAGILAMAVRLEEFLVGEWEKRRGVGKVKAHAVDGSLSGCPEKRALVREFMNARKFSDVQKKREMGQSMNKLFEKRNAHAHPPDQTIPGDEFARIRECALNVDLGLEKLGVDSAALPRLGDVMVSCSLRYDMGNAGDIIKHGVLAEFAEWWPGDKLRFADSFGGRQWGIAKKEVRERLAMLSDCALQRAQRVNNHEARKGVGMEKYYGSSHVVLNTAGSLAEVCVSDSDKLTREDLQAAGRMLELRDSPAQLKVINKDDFDGYDPRDGYSILPHADQFHLVLIDPYADFLRDELALREKIRRGFEHKDEGHFRKIEDAINRNDKLWIAVFVLMQDKESDIYEKLREEHFAERFIALRCPRFPKRKRPAGESRYNMEILLVSSCLASESLRRNVATLRRNIAAFRAAAEKALGGKKIQAWGLDGEEEK